MWGWLKKSKTLKEDLLSFKNEPLSALSVVILIILDLFIFTNVMIGVESETAKAPKAHIHYSYSCVKHFEEPQTHYDEFRYTERLSIAKQSELCKTLNEHIFRLIHADGFETNKEKINHLEDQIAQNNRELSRLQERYNTRLFEKIANLTNDQELRKAKQRYNRLERANQDLTMQLSSMKKVTSFALYTPYQEFIVKNKEKFLNDKESYEFWQPFYEFGYLLVFTIPLLAIFGYFYVRTKRKELKGEHYNPVVKIIASHISLILILPLVWYTLSLVYHVLPKTLLKEIIEFLVDIGLVSLLNYLAIFLVVLLLGSLIYFIQKRSARLKKEAKKGKNLLLNISRSRCFSCTRPVDYKEPFCPYCGEELHTTCQKCGAQQTKHLPFCSACGSEKEVNLSDFC